jgi:hypothetical protein
VNEAFNTYVGPRFRHHNPHFRGDAQSLAKGMAENAEQFPMKVFEVRHGVAPSRPVV